MGRAPTNTADSIGHDAPRVETVTSHAERCERQLTVGEAPCRLLRSGRTGTAIEQARMSVSRQMDQRLGH
jgi:hypothetical protein